MNTPPFTPVLLRRRKSSPGAAMAARLGVDSPVCARGIQITALLVCIAVAARLLLHRLPNTPSDGPSNGTTEGPGNGPSGGLHTGAPSNSLGAPAPAPHAAEAGDAAALPMAWDGGACPELRMVPKAWQSDALMRCIGRRTIVFAGDSRVRLLYYNFVSVLDPTFDIDVDGGKRHEDMHRTVGGLSVLGPVEVRFHWQPSIHDEGLAALTATWERERPPLIIMSAGLWAIKRGDTPSQIQTALLRLRAALAPVALHSTVIWSLLGNVREDLLHPARKNLTNARITALNADAVRYLKHSKHAPHQGVDGEGAPAPHQGCSQSTHLPGQLYAPFAALYIYICVYNIYIYIYIYIYTYMP